MSPKTRRGCPCRDASPATKLFDRILSDPMEENHMMRLYAPRKMADLIFLRRLLWPHLDDGDIAFVNDCWDNGIAKETLEARALYLPHVLVAERRVAATHCCFVCPMQKPVPGAYDHYDNQACMRDPVIASDGHSYERRNVEKLTRQRAEKGKKARSPMTRAVLDARVWPNKALNFAINEAVDRELLEMVERHPRVKSDIEEALMLAMTTSDSEDSADSEDREDSEAGEARGSKRQRRQ
jgi:hypothetical protein